MGAGLNLYGQLKLICKFLFMPIKPPVFACKVHMSYRTDVINHLTADRTCLLRGKIAVVALLEGDADLVGGLHLEALHGLAGFGIHDAVVAGHFSFPFT